MKKVFSFSALIAAAIFTMHCNAGNPVIAKIGSDKIRQSDFVEFVSSLPPQWQARAATPSGKKQILDYLVREKLVGMEAKQRKIDQDPKIAMQLQQAQQRVYMQELMRQWQEEYQIPETELRAEFDKNPDKYKEPAQFNAQHILIKVARNATTAEAEKARKKLEGIRARALKGESFEALAKEFSEDSSAQRGGDLGAVEQGRFHADFEKAALALKPGEISELVRTPFGWHVIKLISVQESRAKTFDEVRDQIKQQLMPQQRQQAFESFMTSLNERYGVEVMEEALNNVVMPGQEPEKKEEPKTDEAAKQETAPAQQPAAAATTAESK